MQIVALGPADDRRVRQAAALLVDGFRKLTDAWPTLGSALDEVRAWFAARPAEPRGPGRRWCRPSAGSAPSPSTTAASGSCTRWWWHHRGNARRWAGAGDGPGGQSSARGVPRPSGWGTKIKPARTSLANSRSLRRPTRDISHGVRNLGNHPFTFYQRLGFTIVGVVPGRQRHWQTGHPDGETDRLTTLHLVRSARVRPGSPAVTIQGESV